MATAVLEENGFSISLDIENYSCAEGDGIHDFGGFDRTICPCVDGGIMHTYCTKCGVIIDGDHE